MIPIDITAINLVLETLSWNHQIQHLSLFQRLQKWIIDGTSIMHFSKSRATYMKWLISFLEYTAPPENAVEHSFDIAMETCTLGSVKERTQMQMGTNLRLNAHLLGLQCLHQKVLQVDS